MTGTQGTARIVARRTVVAAAGAVGLGAALTACGGSDSGSEPDAANGGSADTGSTGSTGSTGDGSTGGDSAAGAGAAIAKTTDIPEGGGKVFADQGVVITQPTAGEFKAFSSKCTHAGCAVKGISDGVINCPCHGSKFSATDGSVQTGPATKPLPATAIKVSGDSITLA
ncbi:Rieske (2Fe-2S) protein [Streptomyces sp. NPDC088400]|uniref:Rieske (2Fe-2S) protein n=1 Tax=Streptomyces sp. NPDC088400 TaxID=3365861 RepID=UPI003821F4A5